MPCFKHLCLFTVCNTQPCFHIAVFQACIDDDLDMVEFLVQNGADLNRGDNEGWTPLHATSSCGVLSIAKYVELFDGVTYVISLLLMLRA